MSTERRKLKKWLAGFILTPIVSCSLPPIVGGNLGAVMAADLLTNDVSIVEPTVSPLPATATAAVPALKAAASAAIESQTLELQSILEEAKGALDMSRLPQVEPAKAELQEAVEQLQAYIVPNSANGVAWSSFLGLEALSSEIAAEQPSLTKLVELETTMRQNYEGLEYPHFLKLRTSLDRYIRALKYGANPDRTLQVLQTRLEELVTKLDTPAEGSMTDRVAGIGLVLTYLHESQQSPEAVQRIRNQFNYPNLQVHASETALNRLVHRAVAEPTPVNECLLGTRLIGQACLAGDVSVDLREMLGGVSLCLNLNACMTSQNIGHNRGVKLHSTGVSPVSASKHITVTPNGISARPASVATDLQTHVYAIEHKLKIVRKIAAKKVAQQKPQADAIAESRLQNRIRNKYDQQVDQQIQEAGVRLSNFRQPRAELVRLGLTKPALALYSTDSSVHGNAVQAASFQLAADRPCGIPQPADAAVVVEAHQSAAVNALDILLSSRTIRSSDVDDLAMQFLGRVPEEVRLEAENEDWAITFANFRPVEIELDDNTVAFSLRFSSMSGANGDINGPSKITAKYQPVFEDGHLVLVRQGEVATDFASGGGGLRNTSLRSVLKKKFDSVFKERIETQDVDLLKSFPNAPRMNVRSLEIDDGWVQVGVH